MTTRLALTDSYVQIAATKTHLMIQASDVCTVYIGTSAPAASAAGFTYRRCKPEPIENFTELGGNAWVKGSGNIVYKTN